jgi:hypothetical protein
MVESVVANAVVSPCWGDKTMERVAFTMAAKADLEEAVEKQISSLVSCTLFKHVKFCHYVHDLEFGGLICQGLMKSLNLEQRQLDWRAIWWKTYEKTVHGKISARRGNASKAVVRDYISEYSGGFILIGLLFVCFGYYSRG